MSGHEGPRGADSSTQSLWSANRPQLHSTMGYTPFAVASHSRSNGSNEGERPRPGVSHRERGGKGGGGQCLLQRHPYSPYSLSQPSPFSLSAERALFTPPLLRSFRHFLVLSSLVSPCSIPPPPSPHLHPTPHTRDGTHHHHPLSSPLPALPVHSFSLSPPPTSLPSPSSLLLCLPPSPPSPPPPPPFVPRSPPPSPRAPFSQPLSLPLFPTSPPPPSLCAE